MKQNQNTINRNSQADEKKPIITKKTWKTPTINVLPVPGLTQGGTITKNAKEGNTKIYKPVS